MAVQLMQGDAGQLCLLIHVSPSHGYTVAFKLQQGTFDFDGGTKLEACNMFATPTWRKSMGAGLWGGQAQPSIFIYHISGKNAGHPRGLGVCACELSEPGTPRNIFPPERLDYEQREKGKPMENKTHIPDTPVTAKSPQGQDFLFWPWATELPYKHILTETHACVKQLADL